MHRLAILVALVSLMVILAGGVTTTMKSGDSEPTWSVRFWEWFRPWRQLTTDYGGTFYELSHRQVGTVLGFLMLWLVGFLWRAEPRRWVRVVGVLAVVALVLQGILGGVRVLVVSDPHYQGWAVNWLRNEDTARIVLSIVHAGLAYALFGLLTALAWVTGTRRADPPPADGASAPELRRLTRWTLAVIFVQLLAGAYVRHAGLQLFAVFLHVIFALPVALLSTWLAVRAQPLKVQAAWASRVLLWWMVLVQAQVVLGIATYILFTLGHPLDPWVRTGHQVLGALILAYGVVVTLRIHLWLGAAAAGRLAAEAHA